MRKFTFLLAAIASAMPLFAKSPVSVTSMTRIMLPEGFYASEQVISPDGTFVVLSDESTISRLDVDTRKLTKIADACEAYDMQVSPDCSKIVFNEAVYIDRLRHVAVKSASTAGGDMRTLIEPSRNLSTGVSLRYNTLNAIDNGRLRSKSLNRSAAVSAPVVSIEYGHLNVTVNGVTRTIDPQGRGSYLWPSISPDGTKIVYYSVGDGCFICDLDGSNVRSLGNIKAAVWAGDDIVVGMDDHDDGYTVTSSRLVASDFKGNKDFITEDKLIAMYPSATPDGSKVTFSTGEAIYILNIEK